MANKRRMIVNGVALSLETPVEGAARKDIDGLTDSQDYLPVSYAQAVEQWGYSAAEAVWKRLRTRATPALATREQFERLRNCPPHSAEAEIIEAIVANSRMGG